ncbi:DUF397 domain-containing protein [Frankia sp. QA3]|uniref:DUF397 domain-containing protein n=1 Tax=Frankia sp. QA3 TaxID=710111 RepID=UPI000269BCD1|nr:DUF397 domain-containing protein [Frankia sp. QA3]EIV92254.1 protein of unknown function (DUF397) [Frankia sp. QA3]
MPDLIGHDDLPDPAEQKPNLSGVDPKSLPWQTSSYSNGAGGMCVQVARVPGGGIAIGDSKSPDGPVLGFSREEFAAFLDGVKDDEFNHLV